MKWAFFITPTISTWIGLPIPALAEIYNHKVNCHGARYSSVELLTFSHCRNWRFTAFIVQTHRHLRIWWWLACKNPSVLLEILPAREREERINKIGVWLLNELRTKLSDSMGNFFKASCLWSTFWIALNVADCIVFLFCPCIYELCCSLLWTFFHLPWWLLFSTLFTVKRDSLWLQLLGALGICLR